MKNLKNFSIIAIVAVITILGCNSCSKKSVEPTEPKTSVIIDQLSDQNNDESNLRTVNDHNWKQIRQYVEVARILGERKKMAVGLDLVHNGTPGLLRMKNLRFLKQFTHPSGYVPGVETITIDCVVSDDFGTTITFTSCDNADCVLDAVADCLGGGGCAVVCQAIVIHILFIPKNILP